MLAPEAGFSNLSVNAFTSVIKWKGLLEPAATWYLLNRVTAKRSLALLDLEIFDFKIPLSYPGTNVCRIVSDFYLNSAFKKILSKVA